MVLKIPSPKCSKNSFNRLNLYTGNFQRASQYPLRYVVFWHLHYRSHSWKSIYWFLSPIGIFENLDLLKLFSNSSSPLLFDHLDLLLNISLSPLLEILLFFFYLLWTFDEFPSLLLQTLSLVKLYLKTH